MNQVPPEIEQKILSFLPIKELIRFRTTCETWNSVIPQVIFYYKVSDFTFKILATMIQRENPLLDFIYPKLSIKQKTCLCRYYAYLGRIDKMKACLSDGAIWNVKTICFLINGFFSIEIKEKILGEYGMAQLKPIHLEVITFLSTKSKRIGPYNGYGIEEAIDDIQNNRFDSLKKSIQDGKIEIYPSLIYTAIHFNNVEIFEWLYQNYLRDPMGFVLNENKMFKFAMENGNIEMIQKILDKGYYLNADMSLIALANGHITLVQWLCDHHGLLIEDLIVIINQINDRYHTYYSYLIKLVTWKNMDSIIMLLKTNSFISIQIGKFAAINGEIFMLAYLIRHGYQLDLELCYLESIAHGQIEIVDYLNQIDPSILTIVWNSCLQKAINNNQTKSMEWLFDHNQNDLDRSYQPMLHYIESTMRCHLDNRQFVCIKTNQKAINYYYQFIDLKN